jgi:hypothetical protein
MHENIQSTSTQSTIAGIQGQNESREETSYNMEQTNSNETSNIAQDANQNKTVKKIKC